MVEYQHKNQYENELEIYLERFLANEFREACHDWVADTEIEYFSSDEPVPFEKIGNRRFRPIKVGDCWSKVNFGCGWFHIKARIPENEDISKLYLKFGDDGEALIVDKDGHAVKGFTDGSPVWGMFDFNTIKNFCPIAEFVDENRNFEAYVDAASNSLFGVYNKGTLNSCYIVRRNEKMLDLDYDFDTLYFFAKRALPMNSEERNHVMYELEKVRNLVQYKDPEYYEKGRKILDDLFNNDKYNCKDNSGINVTAVGHAHLDLAWLWPLRESYRKAKRTFANTVYLFKKYPDYHFVVSQPQQLEWVKQQDPKLFAELQKYEKNGQLEIIGGGWVENDTNVPSEESLVRQELYGQNFWKDNFGHYVNIRWLPDTFGYSAAIPQILKQSRQDYFMTIKISWSNRTIFPYNTFNWEGIDGTSVKVHMPPEGTYNSFSSAYGLLGGVDGIKKTDPQDRFLSVYGVGDGGAGPSELIVERNKRISKIKTMPKVKLGRADEFFKSLDDIDVPTYQGEMYLEKHRATYTSQSNNKNFNRKFEGMMGTYENVLAASGKQGDKELIDKTWKEALLYQFHDILPGSSIQRVYNETDKAYPVLFKRIEKLAREEGYTFRPTVRGNLVNVGNRDLYKLVKVGKGYNVYKGTDSLIRPERVTGGIKKNKIQYVGKHFAAMFDNNGFIKTVELAENNGTLEMHGLNKLRVFTDIGDAWDFVDDYRDQPAVYMHLDNEEITRYGDILEIVQHYSFKESKLVQSIILDWNSKIIDIHHSVDWKNVGYMVRAEFENLGFYSPVVNSDIQFGYLGRPTTDDTEHNAAQFEMCAQKWFDLSDDKHGIAIINRAKDGFMAKNGVISLALFRSTNYPCENAEIKHIEYSYAIYPHAGGFDPVDVDKVADNYNYIPVYGDKALTMPIVDNDQIQITAFKPAYDGNGYILRMFERAGKDTKAKLDLNGYKLVSETNLLEETVGNAAEELTFRPFQIRTFRLTK